MKWKSIPICWLPHVALSLIHICDVHAGDHVTDIKDATTGLPVYSLYGKTRKATPDMLKDVDVLAVSYTHLAQLTDIHLTPNNPNPTEDLLRSVAQINATDSIDFVLVTGCLLYTSRCV